MVASRDYTGVAVRVDAHPLLQAATSASVARYFEIEPDESFSVGVVLIRACKAPV
jgi:hypothetical protein